MAATSPHLGADYDLAAPDITFRDGVPYAIGFEDGYYSAEDGLAETRHVFLDGNDLPARMARAGHLTIAETGFGTGLNLLAVMALMERHPKCHIDFISLEAFPLDAAMMARAHEPFDELADHSAALRAALPPRWPGYHLVPLYDRRLTLHLHYGEARDILPNLEFQADAWFLDGFAPARNPLMWQPEILSQIGRLARPGGTLASFTAAGEVRRGLEEAGFDVERVPGFGRKRQMIRGLRSGHGAAGMVAVPKTVAVIGGGIAGAAVAAGLRRRGAQPVILESGDGPGSGASGNRMALQSPRLTVDHNAMSRLSASCLSFASRLSDKAGASVGHGVVALDSPPRMAERHAIFRTQHWPSDLLQPLCVEHLPSGLSADGSGLFYARGRAIRPEMLLAHMIADVPVRTGVTITGTETADGAVRLHAADGSDFACDAVVLAGGADLPGLLSRAGVTTPIGVSFGQVSHVAATGDLATGVSFGGYLTPALDGLHDLGATFTHDPFNAGDPAVVAQGHNHNLGLLPGMWREWIGPQDHQLLGARIGRRASLPDRRPLAGPVTGDDSAKGVWVFGGLGARGFTLAPLLGEMLAAEIMRHPAPMPRDQRLGVDPARYVGKAE
ncbi:MAG: tRNA (5-methylaminomethyl-2-thiouridine)(34)-methyltransferase MnmD [Candidatus Puniceispirillaceae bacterium]